MARPRNKEAVETDRTVTMWRSFAVRDHPEKDQTQPDYLCVHGAPRAPMAFYCGDSDSFPGQWHDCRSDGQSYDSVSDLIDEHLKRWGR